VTAPDPAFLATATDIVLRAGAIQMARRDSGFRIDKKGEIDLVTEVDLECERMARAVIAERFPDHDILAEELSSGPNEPARARHRWVLDPLDGTTNYAHGLPIFCSAASLEIDGQPVIAAVYDPSRRELFTAERGVGAWLNGVPMRVSHASALIDSLLCTGFPYSVQEDPEELVALFGEFLKRARAVRRLGSAAIDLCYVAAGRLDGFYELKLNPWDISAGALLVQEAGGRVTSLDGGPYSSRGGEVIASNGGVHDAMVETLQVFKSARRSRKGTP
jgi:myo-inositol-1(or 4)-monophosphatase